jgi:predicted AlkP superfamily phosphohydrolase/phosphomutase
MVISNTGWSIFINDERFVDGVVKDRREASKIRDEICNKLKSATDDKGRPLFKSVKYKEEVYHGEYLGILPDLVVDLQHYMASAAVSGYQFWTVQRNYHAEQGILLCYGDGVQARKKIENAALIDVAPTILHTMNLPVLDDMDGKVLLELFQQDAEPRTRAVSQRKSNFQPPDITDEESSDMSNVYQRLKDLGYM